MKKIMFLLLPLSLTTFAATITIYNKSSQPVTVTAVEWIKNWGPRGKSYTIQPNGTQSHNSWLNEISSIEWRYAHRPEGWYARIEMPALNLGGKFVIKDNGKFDSSRLGDNQQAVVLK